jgi:hypothetical protein
MTSWRWEDAAIVRGRIGAICTTDRNPSSVLGDIVLREHQRVAVTQLRNAIGRVGGALLADEVGLGKTYAALATMRDARRLLIVAPAALASMWRSALERSRVRADVVSFESLSRRDAPGHEYDAVIVDEAHHARNPLTRRYARLAEITRSARVLLLSATPVHNAAADLTAVLALFLGSRAERMTAADIGSCIVRRTRGDVPDIRLPGRARPVWCDVPASSELLRAIVNLPSACPPRDGGDGGVLVTLSLVRAWASSEAALRAALRRRIARADALADALATGRHPTRAELRAWVVGDDATQLAFPELVTESVDDDVRGLLESVRRHAAGARRVLAATAASAGAIDDIRCAIVRDIRGRHPGERIVLFSQFADSVREMFARLRSDGGVASVTADGALVAGGPLTRTQVLGRFAPVASSTRPPSRAENIELLIATDLLSEGLNLQDASVVVHLDLPWTPARLTQRLGRIWRIGSSHTCVHEYAIAPPAPANELLHVTELLSRKAGVAWSAIGEALSPLLAARPEHARPTSEADGVTASESLRRILSRWSEIHPADEDRLIAGPSPTASSTAIVAGVRASRSGWIAAIADGDNGRLIGARDGEKPTSDPRRLVEVAVAAEGPACVASPSRVTRVLVAIADHLDAARAAADAGVDDVGSRARAAAATRIAALAASAPPHRRTAVSRLAANARSVVATSRSAGAERLLAALVSHRSGPDGAEAAETWLERIIDARTGVPNADRDDAAGRRERVVALILLVPPGDGGVTPT